MRMPRLLFCAAALAATSLAFAGFPGLDSLEKATKSVSRVVKGGTGLSLEEELAVGDAVAIEILNRHGGVWRNTTATLRVNLVGRVLARSADRQDLDWRFGILNSDTINAFSAPGGRVFITKGLYKLVANDDELAGVLGHEIEHIDRRHAVKIIARAELLGGATELAADRNANFGKFEDSVSKVTDFLLTKGFDPNTEYDADKRGRGLAQVSGFAPGGLRSVIEKLKSKGVDKDAKVFSTHPSAANRLQRLPSDPPPPPAAAAGE